MLALCDIVSNVCHVRVEKLTSDHLGAWYGEVYAMGHPYNIRMFALTKNKYVELKQERRGIDIVGTIRRIIDFFLLRKEQTYWMMRMSDGLRLLDPQIQKSITHVVVYDRSLGHYNEPELSVYMVSSTFWLEDTLNARVE